MESLNDSPGERGTKIWAGIPGEALARSGCRSLSGGVAANSASSYARTT